MPRNLLQATIHLNDGREITTKFSAPAHGDIWGWVVSNVACNMNCDADDVDEIETEAGDRLTVRGEIVGYYKLGNDRPAVAMLQAAE